MIEEEIKLQAKIDNYKYENMQLKASTERSIADASLDEQEEFVRNEWSVIFKYTFLFMMLSLFYCAMQYFLILLCCLVYPITGPFAFAVLFLQAYATIKFLPKGL